MTPNTPPPAGQVAAERARQLGLPVSEILAATDLGSGGLSQSTYYALLNEPGRLEQARPSTRRKLEHALRWEAGSVEDIVNGGSPTPVEAIEEPATGDLTEVVTRALATHQDLMERLDATLEALLVELQLLRADRQAGRSLARGARERTE